VFFGGIDAWPYCRRLASPLAPRPTDSRRGSLLFSRVGTARDVPLAIPSLMSSLFPDIIAREFSPNICHSPTSLCTIVALLYGLSRRGGRVKASPPHVFPFLLDAVRFQTRIPSSLWPRSSRPSPKIQQRLSLIWEIRLF